MRRLIACLFLLMLLTSPALASEPANPADPEMVAELLPACTLVRGIDDGDVLRLLMRNAAGELVFVGGVKSADGTWRFTESAPLPEGTFLGYENFTHSLALPSSRRDAYAAVDVRPYADGTWGVSMVMPAGDGMFFLGQHVIFDGSREVEGHFGDHPWSDITLIDWTSLPDSYEEALTRLDPGSWAVVRNPNPEDRLHLRVSPDKDAASLGKYYNRTPVRIREYGETWCAVTVCGVDGYMMTNYLAFDGEMDAVDYAGPRLTWKYELTERRLYAAPRSSSAFTASTGEYGPSFYVMGVAGDFYHVWLPETEEYSYIRMDDVWEGNG